MSTPLNRVLDYYHVQQTEELLSIHSLIVERVERQGDELICLCPFHNDTHPSLRVHRETGVFRCPACLVTGSIMDLLAKLTNSSVSELWGKINAKPTYDIARLREQVVNISTLNSDSIRYLSVLRAVSDRVDHRLTSMGLGVAELYRQHSYSGIDLSKLPFSNNLELWSDLVIEKIDPGIYDAVILFDEFSSDIDKIITHYHYYRPPEWSASFQNVLAFYQQFVGWCDYVENKISTLLGGLTC